MPTPTDGRSSNTRRHVAAPQATCEETTFGEQPLWRVGSEALRTQLLRIRDSVAPVTEESGIEDIHEMRVASRRLRTMARVLEATPTFRRKRMTRLRKQFQPLASDLGVGTRPRYSLGTPR